MKIAIIDDEILNRLVLKKIIQANCPYAAIVVEDGIIDSAIKKINEHRPDVVLLDVEMKNGTGFDVLQGLEYKPFVIFATAYEKYALQAIKKQVSDYILKPIQEDELLSALNRCKIDLSTNTVPEDDTIRFFSYSTNDERKSISTREIFYFEGAGAYVYCYTNGEKILLSKNIGEIEKTIEEKSFIRCHQSYIVNMKHVIRFNQRRNGNLVLSNGNEVPVSQRKMKVISAILNKV